MGCLLCDPDDQLPRPKGKGAMMKTCYWCEIAGLTGEENQHDENEIGSTDADTGKWICDGCADAVQGR